MKTIVVNINTPDIIDAVTFHEVFKNALDFPDYYGKNMDAWIDYMSDPLDCNVLILNLIDIEDFKKRLPDLFGDMMECVAYVNSRFVTKDIKYQITVSTP